MLQGSAAVVCVRENVRKKGKGWGRKRRNERRKKSTQKGREEREEKETVIKGWRERIVETEEWYTKAGRWKRKRKINSSGEME